MDRALQDVKVVAADVNNKGSGYEKLDNYQLACEVQKLSGYNHFSRSGANLLEEVVRRLINDKPAQSGQRRNSCAMVTQAELRAVQDSAVVFELGTKGFSERHFWDGLKSLMEMRDPAVWGNQLYAVLPQHFMNLLMDDFPHNLIPQILHTTAQVKFYFTADAPTPGFVRYHVYVDWSHALQVVHLSRGMSRFGTTSNDHTDPNNIPAGPGCIYTEGDLKRAKVKVVVATRGKYSNHFQERLMTQLKAAGFGNPQAFYERLTRKYQLINWYKWGERETNDVAIYLMQDDEIFWRWEPITEEQQ